MKNTSFFKNRKWPKFRDTAVGYFAQILSSDGINRCIARAVSSDIHTNATDSRVRKPMREILLFIFVRRLGRGFPSERKISQIFRKFRIVSCLNGLLSCVSELCAGD